jgi:hypothetical protein
MPVERMAVWASLLSPALETTTPPHFGVDPMSVLGIVLTLAYLIVCLAAGFLIGGGLTRRHRPTKENQ